MNGNNDLIFVTIRAEGNNNLISITIRVKGNNDLIFITIRVDRNKTSMVCIIIKTVSQSEWTEAITQAVCNIRKR